MHTNLTPRPDSGTATTATKLDALRREIDRLDDSLLALIEQRLAASHEVAALKQSEGRQWLKFRPRREADIVARLIARARLATPDLVQHVWRELMAYSLQAQGRTELVLWAERDRDALREHARRRFGWAAPLRWADTAADALAAIADQEAIAIIEHDVASSWWTTLAEPGSVRIFDSFRGPDGGLEALLVGRVTAQDVPDGQHFLVLPDREFRDRANAGERLEDVAATAALHLCRSEGLVKPEGSLQEQGR